jgi:UDP-N-acetylmuramate--alanine ligase
MYAVEGLSNTEMAKVGSMAVDALALSDYTVYDVELEGKTNFRVRSQGDDGNAFPKDTPMHLRLPGVHNIQNALAALIAARCIGIDDNVIIQTLENFSGIGRRFEIRHDGPLEINGAIVDVILIDDYAHHPTAISATLEATHKRFPQRRLIAVYQPHMYSRTKTFFDQFLTAFDDADVMIIADIFPGREHDNGSIHTRELVAAMVKSPPFLSSEKRVIYGGNVENTSEILGNTLRSGDVAIVMGAGDIYAVTETVLQRT